MTDSDWTGMGPNNPAPRLDSTCQCICHTQPGVMHVAACCQPLDQGSRSMTHDTPPKQIWIAPVHDQWRRGTGEWMAEFWGLPTETPYILASEADAMVAAAMREAAEGLLDWYTDVEDDRGPHMVVRALIPQPARAALDKLIAEAEARGMERAAVIADKYKRQNGPLTNKGFNENCRWGLEAGAETIASAIRAAKGAQP